VLKEWPAADTAKLLSLYRLYFDRDWNFRLGGETKTNTRSAPPGPGSVRSKTPKPTRRGECALGKIPQNLRRFSLTEFGIPLFYVFRDKRVSCTQAAGVLPGLRVEPTLVRLMTKVGLCRVPERTVIFDSLVLGSRHDTDVRLRPFGHGGINPTSGFKMW
jgi:hypothetical protein